MYIYIYKKRERERERERWVQITPNVTLNNVILPNNMLLNSYFKSLTTELYVLYVLNIHTNFHANPM